MHVAVDGTILAGGYATVTTGDDEAMSITRYLSNGAVDTTFSPNGNKLFDLGNTRDRCYAVASLGDGRIICAGWSGNCVATNECGASDGFLLRLWL